MEHGEGNPDNVAGVNAEVEESCVSFLTTPTLASLGALLGFCDTEAAKSRADVRAEYIFDLVGITRNREYPLPCKTLVDNQVCGLLMKISNDSTIPKGFRFVCSGSHQRRHAITKVNPLSNTFMFGAHLRPHQVLKLVMCFFEELKLDHAVTISGVSVKHVTKWYRKLRQVMHVSAWHAFSPIGGPTFVVEGDESLLYKPKYNKGRQLATRKRQFWSFGAQCRVTKKLFSTVVPRRDRGTLFPVMRKFILPQTHYCSDGWKAYQGCVEYLPAGCGFASHHVVTHNTNFLDPPRGTEPFWKDSANWHPEVRDKKYIGPWPDGKLPFRSHTQTTERAWRSLKSKTRHGGELETTKLEEYQGAFMYRHNILKPLPSLDIKFMQFLVDIRTCYPGPEFEGIKNYWEENVTCHCQDCQQG